MDCKTLTWYPQRNVLQSGIDWPSRLWWRVSLQATGHLHPYTAVMLTGHLITATTSRTHNLHTSTHVHKRLKNARTAMALQCLQATRQMHPHTAVTLSGHLMMKMPKTAWQGHKRPAKGVLLLLKAVAAPWPPMTALCVGRHKSLIWTGCRYDLC